VYVYVHCMAIESGAIGRADESRDAETSSERLSHFNTLLVLFITFSSMLEPRRAETISFCSTASSNPDVLRHEQFNMLPWLPARCQRDPPKRYSMQGRI